MIENHNNRTVVFKVTNKTYGGYEFLEYNQFNKLFSTGNSRAMQGHGNYLTMVTVPTKKELNKIKDQLISNDYKEVETFHNLLKVYE